MTQKPRFVLFAHNATYDKLHQVATLGMTAAAMGKDVIVVLLFWTIKKLAEGRIDEADFPQEYASAASEVARLLKEKKCRRFRKCLPMPSSSAHSVSGLQCRAGVHGCGRASGHSQGR
jgi:peroxiredoxin family protein